MCSTFKVGYEVPTERIARLRMMRIGIIDIGSNTARLLVATVDGASVDRLDEQTAQVRAIAVAEGHVAQHAGAEVGGRGSVTEGRGRVAVAMSGGVDSAVALHRAQPDAVGVTTTAFLPSRTSSAVNA